MVYFFTIKLGEYILFFEELFEELMERERMGFAFHQLFELYLFILEWE